MTFFAGDYDHDETDECVTLNNIVASGKLIELNGGTDVLTANVHPLLNFNHRYVTFIDMQGNEHSCVLCVLRTPVLGVEAALCLATDDAAMANPMLRAA